MNQAILVKWSALSICGMLLVSCSITLPTNFAAINGNEYTLRQIVEGSSCAVACWQSLKPGVSTLQDVDNLLDARDVVPYVVRRLEDESPMTYEWEYPETTLLPNNSERLRHVTVSFSENGMVLRVIVSADLCVTTVTSEYGIPNVILESVYGYPSLVYPQEHLYFSTESNLRIYSIIKTSGENDIPSGTEITWEDFSSTLDDSCVDAFSRRGP